MFSCHALSKGNALFHYKWKESKAIMVPSIFYFILLYYLGSLKLAKNVSLPSSIISHKTMC